MSTFAIEHSRLFYALTFVTGLIGGAAVALIWAV